MSQIELIQGIISIFPDEAGQEPSLPQNMWVSESALLQVCVLVVLKLLSDFISVL